MKLTSLSFIIIFCFSTALSANHQKPSATLTETLVPNPLPVYAKENKVTCTPIHGFEQKKLPVNNDYSGKLGCYIACVSQKPKYAAFSLNYHTHVVGLIRILGQYEQYTCVPKHYKGKNIQNENRFKRLCKKKIKGCKHNCWGMAETGRCLQTYQDSKKS